MINHFEDLTIIPSAYSHYKSYQIFFKLSSNSVIQIGKLGTLKFNRGTYVYTGSALKNIGARIRRHLQHTKTLRWHIDYLLSNPRVKIFKVLLSTTQECKLNKRIAGRIVVAGFGASDCRSGCISHLKML